MFRSPLAKRNRASPDDLVIKTRGEEVYEVWTGGTGSGDSLGGERGLGTNCSRSTLGNPSKLQPVSAVTPFLETETEPRERDQVFANMPDKTNGNFTSKTDIAPDCPGCEGNAIPRKGSSCNDPYCQSGDSEGPPQDSRKEETGNASWFAVSEDSFDLRTSNYQGEEGLELEDECLPGPETSRPDSDEGLALWSLKRCAGIPSMEVDHEEEPPNTTDPFLCHKLLAPYNRMPKPRFFSAAGDDAEYIETFLPGRPRSPVRHVLPGEYNLESATDPRNRLRESKDRISRTVRRLSGTESDEKALVSFAILCAICELVTFGTTRMDIDEYSFISVVTTWALVDLGLQGEDTLSRELSKLSKGLREKHVTATWTFGQRKTRQAVYRPKFHGHACTERIRSRLSWAFVSAAHEGGLANLRPSIGERIEEGTKCRVRASYVPDLTCYHHRDVLKVPPTYSRRSKPLTVAERIDIEEIMTQLVSVV